MRINTCQCCNREFEAKYKNKRYCPECDTALEKKRRREYAEQWRTGKRAEKRMEKSKPALSINDIIRISMQSGRSGVKYGEDVALIEGGKLK